MRQIRLVAAALLLSGFVTATFAQGQDDKNQRDRQKTDTAITGCLTKDASGAYTLTDEKTGVKTAITGPADLEKHSANHRVTLTGAAKIDASGKPVFEVSKIQHISTSCKAPSQ